MTKELNPLYETAEFYLQKQIPVHITLKSGNFANGIILKIREDRLILMEDRHGQMLILFDRIIDDGIEPRYEEVRR